jgi:F0F1-type ATP synthase assembly protein I
LPFKSGLEGPMSIYLIAFIVLMVAWIYGWVGFHVTGGLIHILPVFAVVLLILHFLRRRHGEADLRITR